ncbi:MAG: hypothetical protein IKW04_01265 [Clostridia bacterium]|nr:hypothetical protein [Clostridia bacterium]
MKKLKIIVIAFLLLLLSSASINAQNHPIIIEFPEYYKQISDYEWRTVDHSIRDIPATISAKVAFGNFSDLKYSVFSEKHLKALEQSVRSKDSFAFFHETPKIIVTDSNAYQGIYIAYISTENNKQYANILYQFYFKDQYCTISFVSDNILLVTSEETKNIVDTVSFQEEFFPTGNAAGADTNSSPVETDKPKKSAKQSGAFFTLVLFFLLIFAGIAALSIFKYKIDTFFIKRKLQQLNKPAEKKETLSYTMPRVSPPKVILYNYISGSGPYHEEERLWLETNEDQSCTIYHQITVPMAGGCRNIFTFHKDISKESFTERFHKELPYTRHKFDLTDIEDIFDKLQSQGFISQAKYQKTKSKVSPIKLDGQTVHFDSKLFLKWKSSYSDTSQFEFTGAISLSEKEPVISVLEDGVKTVEYCLQTEKDENFNGKYFIISIRIYMQGIPSAPIAQIDGFISDDPTKRSMTSGDIGYRMEAHFLAFGGEASKKRYEMLRGKDLPMKALKYRGYTTPSNIRLIGICPDCGKSFCFHGYAFYMSQSDIAYSDDGLDCCEITAYEFDKETWTYEEEGKTFRYYNSFSCPHCGTAYIDYKKYPQNKIFGVCGCVHLGRKSYRAD